MCTEACTCVLTGTSVFLLALMVTMTATQTITECQCLVLDRINSTEANKWRIWENCRAVDSGVEKCTYKYEKCPELGPQRMDDLSAGQQWKRTNIDGYPLIGIRGNLLTLDSVGSTSSVPDIIPHGSSKLSSQRLITQPEVEDRMLKMYVDQVTLTRNEEPLTTILNNGSPFQFNLSGNIVTIGDFAEFNQIDSEIKIVNIAPDLNMDDRAKWRYYGYWFLNGGNYLLPINSLTIAPVKADLGSYMITQRYKWPIKNMVYLNAAELIDGLNMFHDLWREYKFPQFQTSQTISWDYPAQDSFNTQATIYYKISVNIPETFRRLIIMFPTYGMYGVTFHHVCPSCTRTSNVGAGFNGFPDVCLSSRLKWVRLEVDDAIKSVDFETDFPFGGVWIVDSTERLSAGEFREFHIVMTHYTGPIADPFHVLNQELTGVVSLNDIGGVYSEILSRCVVRFSVIDRLHDLGLKDSQICNGNYNWMNLTAEIGQNVTRELENEFKITYDSSGFLIDKSLFSMKRHCLRDITMPDAGNRAIISTGSMTLSGDLQGFILGHDMSRTYKPSLDVRVHFNETVSTTEEIRQLLDMPIEGFYSKGRGIRLCAGDDINLCTWRSTISEIFHSEPKIKSRLVVTLPGANFIHRVIQNLAHDTLVTNSIVYFSDLVLPPLREVDGYAESGNHFSPFNNKKFRDDSIEPDNHAYCIGTCFGFGPSGGGGISKEDFDALQDNFIAFAEAVVQEFDTLYKNLDEAANIIGNNFDQLSAVVSALASAVNELKSAVNQNSQNIDVLKQHVQTIQLQLDTLSTKGRIDIFQSALNRFVMKKVLLMKMNGTESWPWELNDNWCLSFYDYCTCYTFNQSDLSTIDFTIPTFRPSSLGTVGTPGVTVPPTVDATEIPQKGMKWWEILLMTIGILLGIAIAGAIIALCIKLGWCPSCTETTVSGPTVTVRDTYHPD